MKRVKRFFVVVLVLSVFVTLFTCNIRSFKNPAPSGIHGHYSLTGDLATYSTTLSKDSVLHLFANNGLTVNNGRLNEYDPPWEGLRYVIGNVNCQRQAVDAYVEFSSKKIKPTTFKVIWIKSEPNLKENDYNRLAEKYHKCFRVIMKSIGIQ
jgi:hypothetical protein